MVPNIDPEQVRKLAGWGLTQNDRASFVGCESSPSSAWVFNQFTPLRRLAIKNPVEQGHGTQSNPLGMKDLWPSASRFWKNQARCQKRSITQILTLSDPKIRGQEPKTLSKRAHNPLLGGNKGTGVVFAPENDRVPLSCLGNVDGPQCPLATRPTIPGWDTNRLIVMLELPGFTSSTTTRETSSCRVKPPR